VLAEASVDEVGGVVADTSAPVWVAEDAAGWLLSFWSAGVLGALAGTSVASPDTGAGVPCMAGLLLLGAVVVWAMAADPITRTVAAPAMAKILSMGDPLLWLDQRRTDTARRLFPQNRHNDNDYQYSEGCIYHILKVVP